MKKLLISVGVALGLLASTATQAQTTEPFLLPTFAYSVESTTGTFTDISTNSNTVKLGEDLAAGTDLKNRVFLGTQIEGRTNVSKVNANNNTATLTDTCFPLGFEFKISGRPMTHFVVSAFGGAYFSDTMVRGANSSMPLTGPASKNCFWAYPYVKSTATSTSCSMAGAGKVVTKEGQAPAMYLISGTENNHVLTIQYDYLVQGDEWVFQFKFYENTGNAEFIVKDLPFANALASDNSPAFHKILLGFTEDGNPVADPFGSSYLNITPIVSGTQHKFTVGQSDAASAAKGWDTLAIGSSAAQPGQMRIDADHHPEEGRTIRFVYPSSCPEHATKYTAEHYNITAQTAMENSFSANIHFQQAMFPSLESIANSGTIVAILSKDETPQYTLSNGTWYKKDNSLSTPATEGAFVETVLCNAQPKFTPNPTKGTYTMGKPIALSATNLEKAMQYYVHIYNMKYDCDGAPVYSELCHTLPFTTSFDMPVKLEAGLPTVNSVSVSAQPADGYAVLLVKSKTLDCKPSGTLAKGDKIGDDAEVLDILTEAGTLNVSLAENEGAYILAFTANTTDPAHHVYAPNALSVSVRAAYPTLPGLIDFANERYIMPDLSNPSWEQMSKTTFRPLPFGWTRETEVETNLRGQAFGTGKPNYDKTLRTHLYAGCNGREFDVVTPVFVCDKERVLATFNMTQFKTENETELVKGGLIVTTKADQTEIPDSVIIEYAIEEGEWISGARFIGEELPELNPEGYYPLECKIEDEGIQGKRMRLRYRFYNNTADQNSFNALPSVEIKEAKLCDKPRGIAQTDALTTDRKAVITWTDDNYPAATAFTVYYKPAGDESDNWENLSAKTTEATIDGLDANTQYTVHITATCGRDGDSDDSYPSAFSTLRGFPYADSMKQAPNYTVTIDGKQITRKGDGPFQRGWTTATGKWVNSADGETMNATLAVTNPSLGDNFSADDSYAALVERNIPTSVAVRENKADTNAWLLSPMLYIEKYGQNYPLSISFKANSAQQVVTTTGEGEDATTTKEWVKGQIPDQYTGAVLYVLVSQNGQFTMNDTIATIPISGQTIEDQAYSFDLAGIEGQAQVAFNFRNPKASDADEAPMMLFEIYDVAFNYVGTPCFPLTDLERSNTTTEQATFTWNGHGAVEYMVYWGLHAAETYADSAKTTDPTYTITGLNDFTRYKVEVVGYCDAEHTQISPATLTASFTTLQACHTPLNFAVTDVTATGATFISATDQPDFMSKRLVYVTPEQGGETQVFEQLNDTMTVSEKFAELTAYVATTQAICGTDSSAVSESKPFTTIAKPIVKDSFDVVLNVTPENAGTVTGAGRYEEGADVTISATAAANYQFVAWMKENDTLSKETSYSFKMPAEALAYTALFVEKQANEETLKAAFNVMTKNGLLHIRNLKGLTIEEVAVYDLTGKLINRFPLNSREDLALPVDAQNALLLVRIATEQGVTVYKVYLH